MPGSIAEFGAASTSTSVFPLLLLKVSVSRLTVRTSACLVNSQALGRPGSCTGCTGALTPRPASASNGAPVTKVSGFSTAAASRSAALAWFSTTREPTSVGLGMFIHSLLYERLDSGDDHVESGPKT